MDEVLEMYSEYQLLRDAESAADIASERISEAMALPVPTFEDGEFAIREWHRIWALADAAALASSRASFAHTRYHLWLNGKVFSH